MNVIANSKLYYLLCPTEKEAQYLVGVINAPAMQPIWRATKTSNLDFHESPFNKIPVPKFDSNDPLHLKIADVINQLELCNSYSPNFSSLNPLVRELMKDTFEQIEKSEHYLFD